MSFNDLRQYIEARMASNWSESASVQYENTPFQAPAHDPWVRLTIVHEEGITQGIGGSTIFVRDPGLIALQVFVPLGDGTKTAKDLVDAFIAIFEHSRFNSITTYSASVGPGRPTDGWYMTNVTIPFRRTRSV